MAIAIFNMKREKSYLSLFILPISARNKMQKLNIYKGRNEIYSKELEKLQRAKISARDKELITKFHNYMFSTGSGDIRVSKVSLQLRKICYWILENLSISKSLDNLIKDDMIVIISLINRIQGISEATKADYRRIIKQFYNWFEDEDKRFESNNEKIKTEAKKFYGYLRKEISCSFKRRKIDPESIITEDDIKIVVDKGCRTAREKAFIMILHETGLRAGEILNLRISNLTFYDTHAEVFVPFSKTTERTVFIRNSIPHLQRYLDVHPFKDTNNSYLWLSEAGHNQHQPLMHTGAQKLIYRCFERAGFIEINRVYAKLENGKTTQRTISRKVNKRCNLHWFRHSRASILATQVPESVLCKYMGWSDGSKQVKNYVHLRKEQLEETFLSIHGVKRKEETINKPIKCVCGIFNQADERYCHRCFKPLEIKTVIEDKELINSEMNKTMKLMMEMAKNPRMMEAFEEFKRQQKD